MIDRRLVQYFDWGLLWLTLLIIVIGLVVLYSAVSAGGTSHQQVVFTKQLVWYGMGLVSMVISFSISYKAFEQWANAIFIVCVVLLLCVSFFGKLAGGSKRWLAIGPFSLQPSEMTKIGVVIVLARYYAKRVSMKGFTIKDLIVPLFLTAIPFILIVNQPDLGTALVVALIAGSMTMFVKIERKSFISLFLLCLFTFPMVWFLLKAYQKQRILTFLNPDRDPLGAGYHIIQSKIAIGSGMLTGKGFLEGTQNALSFLPEQQTDFIFSVLAEEWGLFGSFLILIVFLMIIIWGLYIALRCRDPFGTILAMGIAAMIAWHVFINIGMVMGLLPVVGVTLPFISYGGSSTFTMMIGVGILMNVSMRRFLYEA